ncbi:MAG TPA: alpha/beta hydrolase [Steroidobacteraceae bacterium]|nr:alpha/beta hydrolase [Steroidobacteraceae bacterium]
MRNPIPYYAPLMLGLYGRIAPRQAARFLADLIARPGGQNPTQPWELASGTDGKAIELRTGLHAKSWGEEGPLALALHGWRGRTTQFRPLAAMLLARGMRTVALELPGHGISTGDSASPRLIGELLIEIQRIVGPVHAAIGHSFGGAALGAGLAYGFRPKRLVIVSSPTRVSRIPVWLAKAAGLPPPAMAEFVKILDRDAGRPSAELDLVSAAPKSGIPGLLVHDLKDAVIPYAEAEALANAWPGLKVMTTSGKGHRDILSAPEVLRAIVEFVAARPQSG